MQWFEYVIIAIAIFLVILPFVLRQVNKKKKGGHCSSCCSCPFQSECKKKNNTNE